MTLLIACLLVYGFHLPWYMYVVTAFAWMGSRLGNKVLHEIWGPW